ncbi:MAG: hypothetical protein PWQ35_292 [Patescibacteria group bacterium]|nr:hypothetical protein [Patescibacteria group bacterium]
MEQVLDLHIHSPFSRACSKQINLKNIALTCEKKGVNIVATGDFTHPQWFKIIKKGLRETFPGSGLYYSQEYNSQVKFILSTEVSLIYKDKDKVRRVHLVVQAPNLETVTELNQFLGKRYNIKSDGRPILGMKAPEFVHLLFNISPQFLVYPAHIWTPWFSVFGSKSGFNTLEECFQEETGNIYAFETGLSSDPEMNWRISAFDKLTLLSSSDAHSLNNIGREATVINIDGEASYQKIYDIIRYNKKEGENRLLYTLEFYPEEGMYHLDGHRDCNFSCFPAESKNLGNICPVCHKPLVIGVLNRVEELSDRPPGFKPKTALSFKKLIELDKIIKEVYNIRNRQSLKVQKEYDRLISLFGSELNILLKLDLDELKSEVSPLILEGIKKVREGNLEITPGYDGRYGSLKIK